MAVRKWPATETYPLAAGEKVPKEFGPLRRPVRAVPSGEFRAPRAGEWFLSGAIVEAYWAPRDISTPYMIARLVTGRTVVVWESAEEE